MSSEYGWTTEQILNQTYKELQWRLEALAKRKRSEREFLAALNNKVLMGGASEKAKRPELTDEQKQKINNAMKRGIERKKLISKKN